MQKAEELLNIIYVKFTYFNENMFNDLIDNIYKYFYKNNMICVNKYNKLNKLCSGYFTSFIIPEIGQKYKKDKFNNFSRYNSNYIENLKTLWQETMRLNPNRKVEDLLNKNNKYKVIQNNIVNKTNLNRNYFNMKSNDCNQCGLPFMRYKVPKKCFKEKKIKNGNVGVFKENTCPIPDPTHTRYSYTPISTKPSKLVPTQGHTTRHPWLVQDRPMAYSGGPAARESVLELSDRFSTYASGHIAPGITLATARPVAPAVLVSRVKGDKPPTHNACCRVRLSENFKDKLGKPPTYCVETKLAEC